MYWRKSSICVIIIEVFVLLLFSLQAIGQQQPDANQMLEKFGKDIYRNMKKHHVVGSSIALFSADSVLWSRGFGFADREKKVLASDQTIYMCGSVSKLFVCAGTMQLAEQGLINIDSQVSHYIPEFNLKNRFDTKGKIIIRDVLTHHAGIPSDIFRGFAEKNPAHFSSIVPILANEYAVFPPGLVYTYSNAGYSLLGTLLERVSKLSFETYMDSLLFGPLKMHHSSFNPNQLSSNEIASVYDAKGSRTEEVPFREMPAGGLYTNVADLANFGSTFLENYDRRPIQKEETITEVLKIQNRQVALDLGNEIGLAWHALPGSEFERIYFHTGANLYFRALLAIIPEANMGIAMLTNSRNGSYLIYDCLKILEKFASHFNQDYKHVSSIISGRTKYPMVTNPEGIYVNPGTSVEVLRKRKKYHVYINGTGIRLKKDIDGYIPIYRWLGLFPKKIKHTLIDFIRIDSFELMIETNRKSGVRELIGVKMPLQKISEPWQNRLGAYTIINNEDDEYELIEEFNLFEKDGRLLISVTDGLENQRLDMSLWIESDTLAYVYGLGRYAGYSLKVSKVDEHEVLEIYGYQLFKRKPD